LLLLLFNFNWLFLSDGFYFLGRSWDLLLVGLPIGVLLGLTLILINVLNCKNFVGMWRRRPDAEIPENTFSSEIFVLKFLAR
jgi:hypothetical protein